LSEKKVSTIYYKPQEIPPAYRKEDIKFLAEGNKNAQIKIEHLKSEIEKQKLTQTISINNTKKGKLAEILLKLYEDRGYP
jgi:hypothetical protein